MSIIDNEAENWYGGETYMHSAYIAGATRPPTGEEIEAGAEYYDAMRLAVKAMQGKAAEE